MATVSSIIARARLEIGDTASAFRCEITADGEANTFELSRNRVSASSVAVAVNGVTLNQGTDYIVDETQGLVIFTVVPAQDASVVATGNSYLYFTDTDLTTFVNTAAAQHLYNRRDAMGYAMTLASLPPIEDYLVAILTTIEALWVLATSAAFDIDISTPEGVHIPRTERFQQLSSIINARKSQYTEMAQALNVGFTRVEMLDLRRISRTTGKLVPIYIPQEYEDNRPPTRVFPPIDSLGETVPTNVPEPARTDLVALANQPFSTNLTGLGNLTGLTVRAHVRPYPGNLSSLANFVVTVTDTVNGNATITLTSQQTWSIPPNAFWDIQTVDTSSTVKTLMFGTFYTDRQGQP